MTEPQRSDDYQRGYRHGRADEAAVWEARNHTPEIVADALADQREEIAGLVEGHFLAHDAAPHCVTCRVLRDAVEWIREGKEPS